MVPSQNVTVVLNTTATIAAQHYQLTGWRNRSGARGTAEILWTCITTIIACTWTILHLNMPGPHDGTWTKFWRKLKWMAITIIFPEFTFAKAVCELQMAVEDLHQLSLLQDRFSYHVEYGLGCRLLHRLLTPRSSYYTQHRTFLPTDKNVPSPELPLEWPSEPCDQEKYDSEAWGAIYTANVKRWTLTHCYFANMGGVVVAPSNDPGDLVNSSSLEAVTAHSLAQCCLPNGCDHLKESNLSKQEIDDRSNGDSFVRIVTTLQILWLLISITARASCGLPVSQLEICTVAFAILAIATYLTNWAKPKDVACGLAIVKINSNHAQTCKRHSMRGQSYTDRKTKLAGPGQDVSSRILNDSFRMQTHGTQFRTFSYALRLPNLAFGIVHCIAWRMAFPTQVEKVLWLVASVLATTIPFVCATSGAVLGHFLRFETRKFWRYIQRHTGGSCEDSGVPMSPARHTLFWKDGKLWCSQSNAIEPVLLSAIQELESKLKDLQSQSDHGLVLDKSLNPDFFQTIRSACRQVQQASSAHGYTFTSPPIDTTSFYLIQGGSNGELQRELLSDIYWQSVLCLLCEPSYGVQKAEERWRRIERRVSTINRAFTTFLGSIYFIARMTILILALVALRSQDERVYVDTWAKLLPF